MATMKVHRYEFMHPLLGQRSQSTCLGTKEYITKLGGWILEGSEIEVDASEVDADGKTGRG